MQPIQIKELSRLIGAESLNVREGDDQVSHFTFSSDQVRPGSAFIAICGTAKDGHEFIPHAISQGASLLIVSDRNAAAGHPALVVPDTRKALSRIASLINGEPSSSLKVTGVTGTNGKTTTNWIIHNLSILCGVPSLRIGTLGNAYTPKNGEQVIRDGNLTTPDPMEMHALMKEALGQGVENCVIEVSSHALFQSRADDIAFDAALFTNLTRDHLDYHSDMEEYFNAKKLLFRLLASGTKKTRVAVINTDCQYGRILAQEARAMNLNLCTFGRSEDADLRILQFRQEMEGTTFSFVFQGKEHEAVIPFIGYHNIENVCGAFGVLAGLGQEIGRLIELAPRIPQVPGRLEAVGGAPGFGVFVDYAHTPDALQNVLKSLRAVVKGDLWALFGCGGDRDRGKRPQMAAVARELADRVVVTSDNPRTEDPVAIINDILSGGVTADIVEPDRREAIRKAVSLARPGDVVLIAGKGHEDYQIIGTQKYPFLDVDEAQKAIRHIVR